MTKVNEWRRRPEVVPAEALRRQARARARRRPSWVLRRRERQIVALRFPDKGELVELAAVRSELRVRSLPAGRWWRG